MRAGDTFLITRGSDRDDHLWVIISDPAIDAENVLAVMLVSWDERYDQACVLESDDHPFIKHSTCVQYREAHIWPDSRLNKLADENILRRKAPVSAELLARIRQCAEDGDLPTRAYELLREQGFVR